MKRHFITAAVLALCLFGSMVQAQVVISEFRTSGSGGATDEFIELYNLTASSVDISNWTIWKSNSTGTALQIATIPASTTIPPYSFYLIAGSSYSGGVTPNFSFSPDIADDGGIALLNLGPTTVDQVGLAVGSAYKEGTSLAAFSGTGSYERKAVAASTAGTMYLGVHRFAGNEFDAGDNASDFVAQAPATPQNSSSPIEGRIIHNTPSDGYAALLQDALAIVQTGDEVSVPSGTYTGEMNVNTTGISIVGVGESKPVIENASGHGFVIADGISNVTINNFDITVMDDGVRSVSSFSSPSSMISVLNSDISGGSVGISLQYSNNATISGTTINENTTGIIVDNVNTVSVTGSTINSNATGMGIYTTTGVTLFNNRVNSNTNGIEINWDSHTISITNNDLAGNSNTTLLNNSSTTVLATGNWWGSANGPTHPSNTYNVSSQGAVVYGNADVAPWAAVADDDSDEDGWQPSLPLFEAVKAYNEANEPIGTFASIQAAIEAVEQSVPVGTEGGTAVQAVQSFPPSGMRVEAVAGTFTEQLSLDSYGMLVKGRDENPTTIAAGSGTGITLNGISTVSLFNLEISSTSTGLLVSGSSNVEVTRISVAGAADGVYVENSSEVLVEASTLNGNTRGISLSDVSTFSANNNFITNNATGIRVQGSSSFVTARYNSFAGNTVALENSTPSNVSALFNWWGGAAGPQHASNDNTIDLGMQISDGVTYSPWLALGTDGSADPGFQRAMPVTFGVNTSTESSIQLAVDEAIPHENAEDPGDVVQVYSGTYGQKVTINKAGLKVEGLGATRPIISVSEESAIDVVTTNASISNMEVIADLAVAVSAQNAEGFEMSDSYVHDSYIGIDLVNSPFAAISNNTINANGSDGIRVESSQSVSVTGNTANSNGNHELHEGNGIRVSGSFHTVNSNTTNLNADYGIWADAGAEVTVNGNTATGNWDAGLYIGGVAGLSNSQINDNIANGNNPSASGTGIKVINSGLNVFQRNTANQNSTGFTLQYSDGNKILNGESSNNESVGLKLFFSSDNLLAGSSIEGNGENGVLIDDGSDNTTVWNNTIAMNGNGGGQEGGVFIGESAGSRQSVSANVFSGNKPVAVLVGEGMPDAMIERPEAVRNQTPGLGETSGAKSGNRQTIASQLSMSGTIGTMVIALNNFATGNGQTHGVYLGFSVPLQNELLSSSLIFDPFLVAQHNWWGGSGGPEHESNSNPNQGVAVSDYVDFLYAKTSPISLPVVTAGPVVNSTQPEVVYATISEALQNANTTGNLQTISVRLGGYSEPEGISIIRENIKLVGTGKDNSYVRLFGTSVDIDNNDITVEGFDFDNGGRLDPETHEFLLGDDNVIRVLSVYGNDVIVKNNRIRGAGTSYVGTVYGSAPEAGISTSRSTSIYSDGGIGVDIQYGTNVVVELNEIFWNQSAGVQDEGSDTDNIIRLNEIFANGDLNLVESGIPVAGIVLEWSSGSQVRDNNIYENVNHGVRAYSADNAVIENNVIQYNGVNVDGGFSRPAGIVVKYGNATLISNNTVTDNAGVGIWSRNSWETEIMGNTVGGIEEPNEITSKKAVKSVKPSLTSATLKRAEKEDDGLLVSRTGVNPRAERDRLVAAEREKNRSAGKQRRVETQARGSATFKSTASVEKKDASRRPLPSQRRGAARVAVIPKHEVGLSADTKTSASPASAVISTAGGNSDDGIHVDYYTALVIDNTVEGNVGHGVLIENVNSSRVNGNTVSNNQESGITVSNSSDVDVTVNTVLDNGSVGIHFPSSEVPVAFFSGFNRLGGNASFGILNENASAEALVDGRFNWWGHASGPSGGEVDPETDQLADGSGDAVSANVRFDPFFGVVPTQISGADFDAEADPSPATLGLTGVAIDFSTTGSGGTVVVARINQAPPPGPITDPDNTGLSFTILGLYWEVIQLGGLSGFTADLLFDFEGVSGITNPANLRIAKRVGFASGGTGWVLIPLSNTSVNIGGESITASGQTDLSQWALVQAGQISPTFVSVAPNALTDGQVNVLVTINGTGFLNGITTVDFGEGIVVHSTTVNSSAELVADVSVGPGANPGPRDVVVSNGPGLTITEASGVTVLPAAATLVSLAPNSGMPGQTLDVTVAGQFFYSGLTAVGFGGGIGVNSVTVNSSSQLTANITVAANAAPGARNVSVSNDGSVFSTLTNGFTVASAVPALTAVAPASGSRGESLSVGLTGANFVTGTTTVGFGEGITVDSIKVVSATEITAYVSIDVASSTGPRDIIISNGSTASVTGTGVFTVVNPAPSVTGVSPQLATKGTTVDVEITGTGLISGVTAVSFGNGITVNSLNVGSTAQATASITVDPAASTGARDVTVVNATPGGGTVALSEGFTVGNVAPTLTGVSPASAIRGSILNVTVTGTGFEAGATTVSFGDDISVNTLSVTGSGELVATIAIGAIAATGARPVSVTNAAPGGGEVSLAGVFTVETGTPSRAENMLDLIPEVFVLHEAYPNPFNPATKIRYAIPEGARVKLEIYNMLGNVVAALVEGEKQKGYYEITWVAENQPSGVYLVRMQAEGLESQKRFIGSRKVVLVK